MPQGPELEGSVHDLSDALVFSVATRWMTAQGEDQKKLTSMIALWLVKEHSNELPWIDLRWNEKRRIDLTRYRVYKIVREAVDRGFVQLNPPQAAKRAASLYEKYQLDGRWNEVRIVDVTEDVVNDMVARATAEIAVSLIKKLTVQNALAAEEAGKPAGEAEPIGIGLGAGYSSLAVISYLAKMLRSLPAYPKLRLHALTPTIQDPMLSPVTFFRLFDVPDQIEFVDLPTAATVPMRDYARLQVQDENIERAFQLRNKVQLIISSLAWSGDPHGLMQSYLKHHSRKPKGLDASRFAGDLQYLPYDESGPVLFPSQGLEAGIDIGSQGDKENWRAVTLFDWPDLLNFHAGNTQPQDGPQRYLVISAAPCRRCSRSKWRAIAPLLRKMRFWTHLVTDDLTARELIDERDLRHPVETAD
ncbi:MAG: hypothetical protein K8U03_08610 [Planctomycetia bacterium]|nr:hypothetical protein [Planctomycetia bacterium]